MRKRMIALLVLLCMAAAALPVLAESAGTEVAAYRIVYDDAAGLVDAAERDGLEAEMRKITEYCNVGFYTCTGDSFTAVMTKAKKWVDRNFRDDEDCTVFIIDMANREIGIWSTEAVRKDLTTAKANLICSNIYKMATNGKYADCAKEAFRQMYTVLSGGKTAGTMKYIGNALMAVAAAILLAYLLISARMEQEVKVSMPEIVTATAGVGAAIVAKRLTKVVHHESSSGGHGGFGGGGGGGGGHSGGGGSHGF